MRTRLTGRSSLPSPSIYIQGSERTPKTGAGPSRAEGSPGPAIVTSPLNMRCSLLEPVVSEVSAGIDEALNSQFGKWFLFSPCILPMRLSETSSESRDRSRDSSTRRHRRSPPPPPRRLTPSIDSRLSSETSRNSGSDSPRRSHSVRRSPPPPPRQLAPSIDSRLPLEGPSNSGSGSPRRSHSVRRSPPPPPRQLAPSIDSRLSLETSSNLGSESPRRSQSVRRPAPPPPQSPRQSRTPRLPTNVSLSSHGPLPPDPAMIASISQFAQQISTLASSIATESLSTQAPGRRGSRRSGYVTTTKTNCVDITDSNVDGLTLNNGGTNNSGAGASSFFALLSWPFLTTGPDTQSFTRP